MCKIKLTQAGLIKMVLAVTGMKECAKVSTPTEIKVLVKDEEGDPPMERWSYASILGMLIYLASNFRSGIMFVVHQCVSFCHCTCRSHERVVKKYYSIYKEKETKG